MVFYNLAPNLEKKMGLVILGSSAVMTPELNRALG